jgi:hypothetical protein
MGHTELFVAKQSRKKVDREVVRDCGLKMEKPVPEEYNIGQIL